MAELRDLDIRVVIPALNEAAAIAEVVRAVPDFVRETIVVDNGSTDGTGGIAERAGARVVRAGPPGYGRACLAGIAAAGPCDIIVFMDGDRADDPADMAALVAPIAAGATDLVIGARTYIEAGALTPQQRWGNALATFLMRKIWGGPFTDLGPFRAMRRSALASLRMQDETYGWTVEMQARALKAGLVCAEIPVRYRARVGRSKISGTIRGVVLAGVCILTVIAREWRASPRFKRGARSAASAPFHGSRGQAAGRREGRT